MKQLKREIDYGVLAVLLMSSLSACASLPMEDMSPMQGRPTIDRPGMELPATGGDYIAANGSEMNRPGTVREVVAASGSRMVRPASPGEVVAGSASEMVQPPSTGEFVTVVGCAGSGQEPTLHTECRQARWDPSGAQVAASIAIGVAWYSFAVIKPSADALRWWMR